jgi:hypothetical protein
MLTQPHVISRSLSCSYRLETRHEMYVISRSLSCSYRLETRHEMYVISRSLSCSYRFDFNLTRAMTAEEVSEVERLVNSWVATASPLKVVFRECRHARQELKVHSSCFIYSLCSAVTGVQSYDTEHCVVQ